VVQIIFRSRLRPEFSDEYQELAPKILELARGMPGFVSHKSFVADDGERVSLIEFELLEHVDAWREQPDHLRAQALGRERYYAEYSLQVGELERVRRFDHEE